MVIAPHKRMHWIDHFNLTAGFTYPVRLAISVTHYDKMFFNGYEEKYLAHYAEVEEWLEHNEMELQYGLTKHPTNTHMADLKDKNGDYTYVMVRDEQMSFAFRNDAEAMAFKMRWL